MERFRDSCRLDELIEFEDDWMKEGIESGLDDGLKDTTKGQSLNMFLTMLDSEKNVNVGGGTVGSQTMVSIYVSCLRTHRLTYAESSGAGAWGKIKSCPLLAAVANETDCGVDDVDMTALRICAGGRGKSDFSFQGWHSRERPREFLMYLFLVDALHLLHWQSLGVLFRLPERWGVQRIILLMDVVETDKGQPLQKSGQAGIEFWYCEESWGNGINSSPRKRADDMRFQVVFLCRILEN